MTEKNGSRDARRLNPDLRKSDETTHSTDRPTQPPVDSTSTGSGDNKGWTFAWAVVTIICVLIAIWLIL